MTYRRHDRLRWLRSGVGGLFVVAVATGLVAGPGAAATTAAVSVNVDQAGVTLQVPGEWRQASVGFPDPGGLGPSVFFAWDAERHGFTPNVQVRVPTGSLPTSPDDYRTLPWVRHPGTQVNLEPVTVDGRPAFRDDVRYRVGGFGALRRSTLAIQVAPDHITTVQVQSRDTVAGRRRADQILASVVVSGVAGVTADRAP